MNFRSLIGADGWNAVFHDRVAGSDGVTLVERDEPLIGFAIVGDRVVGS